MRLMELPDHLTEEKIEQFAHASETLFEFSRKARVSRYTAKRLLRGRGLSDSVETAGKLL